MPVTSREEFVELQNRAMPVHCYVGQHKNYAGRSAGDLYLAQQITPINPVQTFFTIYATPRTIRDLLAVIEKHEFMGDFGDSFVTVEALRKLEPDLKLLREQPVHA